jgi:glycolate oxidase FAD binding subunit
MNNAAGTALSRLVSIAGSSHIAVDRSSVAAYSIDGVAPVLSVRPGTAEEVMEIVKLAAAEKLALVANGGRTKLAMGMPPRKYDVALDLSRLDRVIAYDPGDLTLSVEPGVLLVQLAAVLAEHGQFLPLAAPYENSATVGGTLASGVDSPLRQFYGTARDYVLGMEFVTGDGSLAKSGGRVVKNVTGYDLHKLMIGSMGTLGVIAKIHFRTFPAPHNPRAFLAFFKRSEQAWAMRQAIADSPLRPLTLDILSPGVGGLFTSDAAERQAPGAYDPRSIADTQWTLTTGFSGDERVVARYAAELHRMAESADATETTILSGNQVSGAFGRKREFIPIALASSPATLILKLSVLPDRMCGLLSAIEKVARAQSINWAAVIRGVGVAYVALLPKEMSAETARGVAKATEEIFTSVAGAEGNESIPWCPSVWKSQLKIWGPERGDFTHMRKLKAFFDPGGVFAPGRFVGGI